MQAKFIVKILCDSSYSFQYAPYAQDGTFRVSQARRVYAVQPCSFQEHCCIFCTYRDLSAQAVHAHLYVRLELNRKVSSKPMSL